MDRHRAARGQVIFCPLGLAVFRRPHENGRLRLFGTQEDLARCATQESGAHGYTKSTDQPVRRRAVPSLPTLGHTVSDNKKPSVRGTPFQDGQVDILSSPSASKRDGVHGF